MPDRSVQGAGGSTSPDHPPAATTTGAAATQPETLLAFDFGLKKIGVAIGNTLIRQARPLEIITAVTREQRFAAIAALLAAWQPERLVVGLPLTEQGGEQYASLQSRRFANQLRGRFNATVELVNEWGSSVEAQALLGTNAADDAMAAAVILQRYFDSLSPPQSA